MFSLLLQNAAPNRGSNLFSVLRHLGALGLFFLAVLDSSPIPTFGGPDILLVILVSTRRNPWYEYAAAEFVSDAAKLRRVRRDSENIRSEDRPCLRSDRPL